MARAIELWGHRLDYRCRENGRFRRHGYFCSQAARGEKRARTGRTRPGFPMVTLRRGRLAAKARLPSLSREAGLAGKGCL